MFGRTKGRKLSKKQHFFINNHLKDLLLDESVIEDYFLTKTTFDSGITSEKVFALEIGFGSGEHIVHKAQSRPDVQFIGCDYYLNGIASTVIKIIEREINNVRIFYGEALNVLHKIPDNSLHEIFLLYPDPWPKSKHIKRRFVSVDNLQLLSRKLASLGSIKIVSDSETYFSHTQSEILKLENSSRLRFETDDFSKPWLDWCMTKYEEKAKIAGRKSYYMILKKAEPI